MAFDPSIHINNNTINQYIMRVHICQLLVELQFGSTCISNCYTVVIAKCTRN